MKCHLKTIINQENYIMDKLLEDYLGNGVYAIHDGFGIWLYANHHEFPTDKVYLEPLVLEALNNFIKRAEEKIKLMQTKNKES